MADKRRGLGRGLGALIPDSPAGARPVDVFFAERASEPELDQQDAVDRARSADVSRETDAQAKAPRDAANVEDGRAPEPETETPVPSTENAATDLRPVPGARFAELQVASIRPNPRQPRTVFDEDELSELSHSIAEIGVLQPVVVREVGAREDGPEPQYELIMGERRWRATQEAGLATIPAIIKQTADDDLLRDALLENLHRSQLNPLEEAAAYQQLLDDFGCTQEDLSVRIGRSRPQISNTLRLLRLPPLVQRRVAANVISAGHARALLALSDAGAMERLAQRIVAEGLSVRTVEELVTLGDGEERVRRTAPRAGARHPQLEDLGSALADRLETRVTMSLGRRKGRIAIDFASMEDLRRILDILGVQHPDEQDADETARHDDGDAARG